MTITGLSLPFSACSVSLWFNSKRRLSSKGEFTTEAQSTQRRP